MSSAVAQLLRVRELREREARQRLAEAQREHLLAEERLRDAYDRLAAQPRVDRAGPHHFQADAATRAALATEVVTAQARTKDSHEAVLAARQGWLTHDQDRDAADRLVARVTDEARERADRAVTREADDGAVGRHVRRRHAGADGAR